MTKKRIVLSLIVLCVAGVAFLMIKKSANLPAEQSVAQSILQAQPKTPIQAYKRLEQTPPNFTDVATTEELKALFADVRFDEMPRIFVRRFPDDFGVKGDPVLFAKVLLPHLLRQNELLLKERKLFTVMSDKIKNGEPLTEEEDAFWNELVLKYESLERDKAGQQETLYNRIDHISPSLAIAQGLEATQFAKEDLDAPFDVRRWNDKKEYDYVRYPDLAAAVADYALELNRGYSYLKFHMMRTGQRASIYHPLIGKTFARGMVYYKLEDPDYVNKLREIFEWYNFQKLDESSFRKE